MRAFLTSTLLFLLVVPVFAQPNEAESIDAKLREAIPDDGTDAASKKILETHLRSLGGLGRIMTIRNTVSKGILKEAKEDYDMVYYRAAPDKIRVETSQTFMGRPQTLIEGYNGEIAWEYDKRSENAFPKEVSAKQAADLIQEADFYGPLVNWEEKGYVFKYEGEVKSRGRKHYLLKMFYPNGRTVYFYFDAKTLLVTRVGREKNVRNTLVDTDVYYTKYDRVDGIWMPVKYEFALEDQIFGSLTLDSIEANQPMDLEIFNVPKIKERWLRKN
ncbi:hypothetical protein [Rubellicoccus peritrichatus]|uniref:Outer membrane lipoprotein-sorting protein n=1 Tax=Rubellicoccus peritrichatus TaxID=3080537 RepID=A0AAQ3QRD8_9BACT|nr:hypothetical protein [Puniceicoccus sp. CR14]WOO39271.1 hypothetical protein RZN69_11665 [Puniceicoccus sp. CR14]